MNAPLRATTIIVILFSAALVHSQQSTISVGEARKLVVLVLQLQGFPSSRQDCRVESLDKDGKPFAPDYYAFGASCHFPSTAAPTSWGRYLVSPRTGGVLNFDTCMWLEHHDLRERQEQIMLQTGGTQDSERKYRDATGCKKTAQQRLCSTAEAQRADESANMQRSWDGLYKSYKLYRHCDDGAIWEGYSESAARILFDHWKTLPRLDTLARDDAGFRRFVFKHIEPTAFDGNDLKRLKTKCKKECPSELGALCTDLTKRADAVLLEMEKSN
jgi:hypothetical protein